MPFEQIKGDDEDEGSCHPVAGAEALSKVSRPKSAVDHHHAHPALMRPQDQMTYFKLLNTQDAEAERV